MYQVSNRLHGILTTMLEVFTDFFNSYYAFISSSKDIVSLVYDSNLSNNDFGQLLKSNYAKDQTAQYTTVGIHKDDLLFFIGEKPLKKFGSH